MTLQHKAKNKIELDTSPSSVQYKCSLSMQKISQFNEPTHNRLNLMNLHCGLCTEAIIAYYETSSHNSW